MRRTEMLWFEDVSAINEPVLSFPIFGRISMRQFFILGIAGMISYGLFSATHGPVSAIPIGMGALFTFVKPRVGSTESMILSAVLYLAGRRIGHRTPKGKKPKAMKCGKTSKKLYLPSRFHTQAKGTGRAGLVEITISLEFDP